MRQIEFRGLRKDGKGWVYGCYSIYRGKTDGPILHRISWDDGHNGFFAEVDPSTVGQFTGLHDLEGKKIFEFDLDKSGYHIAYNHMHACWGLFSVGGSFIRDLLCNPYKNEDELYDKWTDDTIEIIGTKFDNPELIKP